MASESRLPAESRGTAHFSRAGVRPREGGLDRGIIRHMSMAKTAGSRTAKYSRPISSAVSKIACFKAGARTATPRGLVLGAEPGFAARIGALRPDRGQKHWVRP
jgi:hypothetical protein